MRAPRVSQPIVATVSAGKRGPERFTIQNISISGAKLEGPLALALRERITLVFKAGDESVTLQAEVVRVETADLMSDEIAVAFVDMTEATREAIRALVNRVLDDAEDDPE